jgi:hypothetical protein
MKGEVDIKKYFMTHCFSHIIYVINLRSIRRANSALCCESPATNRLSHGATKNTSQNMRGS